VIQYPKDNLYNSNRETLGEKEEVFVVNSMRPERPQRSGKQRVHSNREAGELGRGTAIGGGTLMTKSIQKEKRLREAAHTRAWEDQKKESPDTNRHLVGGV